MKKFYLFSIFSIFVLFALGQKIKFDLNPSSKEVTEKLQNQLNLPCNNWLYTPIDQSYVNIGQLNIMGTQLTVEAVFNRTTPYQSGTQNFNDGDIVSKHDSPSDVNYLLRPNHAYITTSNGFFGTPDACLLDINKTYHIAMVYDGVTLKYYRNGYLLSQVNATGNLFQNNWPTRIGRYSGPVLSNFIGFTNEVRIWNVARTQSQIRANMNTSLPSPSTQPGLQAYYIFNDLINKQGNPAWNGTLNGGATINSTNTSCTLTTDSCNVLVPQELIINQYTPALSLDACTNKLAVQDASAFNIGDTVLLIQMKGALIDSSNTAAFGNITDIAEAGNYDINYVKSKIGNQIELKNKLLKSYNFLNGKVQLVRVPYFQNNLTVTDNLTCQPWNGATGGILIFEVKDTLKLNRDIDVSAKGFLGGTGFNSGANVFGCDKNEYYYPISDIWSGLKGESIASISQNKIRGKGKLAGGGGGGNGHNSGGGGGANGGQGGIGGYQLNLGCSGSAVENRGVPGVAISTVANNGNNKIFLGSGGGAGQADNPGNIPPKGGNGGGIIIIKADYMQSNNFKLKTNGENAVECTQVPGSDCHDGMGGGGAGGTVFLSVNGYIGTAATEQKGGKGANVSSTISAYGKVGPGGGGGGGVLLLSQASLPPTISNISNGGQNGTLALAGNTNYGSAPGVSGLIHFNNNLQFDIISFKKNIDSVRIQKVTTGCSSYNFSGVPYTNTSSITSWLWNFGDGNTANTQNTSHTYNSTGSFIVRLNVTDINGCKDSFNIIVSGNALTLIVDADTSFCSNASVSRQLNASGSSGSYSWAPANLLNNSSIPNPVATVSATTKFYVTLTDPAGCSKTDSITLSVNPLPAVVSITDTTICKNSTLLLTTTSNASIYNWTPATFVSNPGILSPQFTGNVSQDLYVNVISANGCRNADTIQITVKPLPIVKTIDDTTICETSTLSFNATGAQNYSWNPVTYLTNPGSSNPLFNGPAGNYVYIVNGTGSNLCIGKDTLNLVVKSSTTLQQPPNAELCKGAAVALNGNNGSAVTYTWSPSPTLSSYTIQSPLASPSVTTTYSLNVYEPVCNLSRDFQIKATVNPLPIVVASKSNDLSCGIHNAKLFSSGAISYVWTPAATLNNATIASPTASPGVSTLYIVTGKDGKGCVNKDSVKIEVSNANVLYQVPNTFTPNGDRINDCFSVRSFGLTQNYRLIIYNRFGEKVFETNNYLDCWNGKYKGQPATPGNYVYYLTGKNACGQVVRNGNLLLLR